MDVPSSPGAPFSPVIRTGFDHSLSDNLSFETNVLVDIHIGGMKSLLFAPHLFVYVVSFFVKS
jgi:hypothetical protein